MIDPTLTKTQYDAYQDFGEIVGSEVIKNNLVKVNKYNWHHLRTLAFWACVFITGGLQALKGNNAADFTFLVSILGFLEHALAGNATMDK